MVITGIDKDAILKVHNYFLEAELVWIVYYIQMALMGR